MDAEFYFATSRDDFDYESLFAKVRNKERLDYWEHRALYFAPTDINGKPNTLYKLITQLVKRFEADRDTVIAVTGQQGMGKSSLAILIAQEVAKEIKCRAFDIKRDVIYNGDQKEIYEAVYGDLAKNVPVVFDEFLSYASKHKWFTAENKYLEDVFLVSRTQNKVCILVGPRLGDFSEQFRNQRIILNIEILKRGKAVLFMRHESSFLSDPWNLKSLEKLIIQNARDFLMMAIGKKKEFYKESGVLVAGVISYPNLDRSSACKYKALSSAAKEIKIKPQEQNLLKEKRDLAFAQLLTSLHEKGQSFEEIGRAAGYSGNAVSKLVNEFSKGKLNSFTKEVVIDEKNNDE